tara:strand:+ start:266 stop:475 length:210 start_codon:yes stop_codon:yes gene_type:complete
MFEKDFKSLGIKDMHSMQVEALMEFVGTTLHLAALCNDREILYETEELADNLVRLFGGNGVKVVIEADY